MELEGSLPCSLELVPLLSQKHSLHTISPYLPMIHPSIIFPSTPKSSEWSFLFRFSDQNFVCISYLFHVCYMSTHLILLYLITLIIFGEE